jgi:CDP-diacylglycerol--serine O-phosphatidyltransferase
MHSSKRTRRFAYLLPNMITALGMFVGIFSMIQAIDGNFSDAAWLIFLALLFDGLDGRVARLTNTSSRFGEEFDSLSDIISFGAAPALLVYLYTGHEFGRAGVIVSAFYVIFGAIRLARFNVFSAKMEPSVFIGVPIPTAAVFVSLMILLCEKYQSLQAHGVSVLAGTVLIAMLMVSNIRYPSFKKVDIHAPHIMRLFVTMLFVAALIFLFPIEGFSFFFALYILYGPVRAAVNIHKRGRIVRKRG